MSILTAQSPDAVLDWNFNWDDGFLQSDESIQTSIMFVIPAGFGLKIDSESIVSGNKSTTVTLSGATHGRTYLVCNKMTSTKSRVAVRSFTIRGYAQL